MNNSTGTKNGPRVQGYDPFYRTHVTIIAQVTSLIVLGVIIVGGNLVSIITFVKTQSLLRRSHYLIISLSVADLLVGVVDFMCVYFFWTGPQWNDFVVALEVMDTLTGITSILTLSNISLERFYAIFFPFRHRMLRHRVYVVFCSLPWVFSTYIAGLYIASRRDKSLLEIYTYHTFGVATVALMIISVSYITIGVKIRDNNPSAQDQRRTSRDQRLAVTLLIVTLASVTTWLPLQCFLVILYFCKTCPLPHFNVLYAMKFLQFCNSGINVFIYIVRMPEFRSAFLVLFCGKDERNSGVQESTRMTSTASVKNNGFVGDVNEAANSCRNRTSIGQKSNDKLPLYNSMNPDPKTQTENYRKPYQINNTNIQNGDTRANNYPNPANSNPTSCKTKPQEDKEVEQGKLPAAAMNKKPDNSLDGIEVNIRGMNDKPTHQQRGIAQTEGVINHACVNEANETVDSRL